MDGAAVPAVDPGAAAAWDPCGEGEAELAHARRARLRDAQAAVAAASWRAEKALAVADAALADVTAARELLDGFADLSGRIAAHRAGLLRAGVPGGGRAELPAELADARAAAFAASVALTDAEAAHDLLSIEAREAAGAAVEAGALLRAAADQLVQAEMLRVMLTARRAEREAGRARVTLMGYANTRGLSEPPPWPLQQMFMDPWNGPLCDAAGVVWQAAAEQWNDYRRALLTDAAATFGG